MTLSVGMLALLNSNILAYAEPLGKLVALIEEGRATVTLTSRIQNRSEGIHVMVVCHLHFYDGVPIEATSEDSVIEAIKKAADTARVRGLL
jgi:hypothetical protein